MDKKSLDEIAKKLIDDFNEIKAEYEREVNKNRGAAGFERAKLVYITDLMNHINDRYHTNYILPLLP